MHFHLPKPVHGWRGFFGEVGIIVVGVLIALAAEELLTEFNWHRKAEVGEAALKSEAEESSQAYVEQLTVGPCILAQIEDLRSRVLSHEGLGHVQTYDSSLGRSVIRAPSRTYSSDVWSSQLADGTAAHMKTSRQQATASYYAQLAGLIAGDSEAENMRDGLVVLADPITMDARQRFDILQTLGRLRNQTTGQMLAAKQLLAQLRDLGRLAPPSTLEKYVEQSKTRGTARMCAERNFPLGDWHRELASETVKPVPSL